MMSSAADWCRAVLEGVSPSPLNSVPPLPAHVPVPPPPPPASRGSAATSSSAVPSASATTNSLIPQPSAQYQAYYNQYYQQAYPATQAAATSDSYNMHPQSLQQTSAAYQPMTTQYQQQQRQLQQQQQHQQQQQAMYYQQPSYTSVVQQGSAAWQNAVKQHSQSQINGDINGSRYNQQSADGQQYSYATHQQQPVVSPAASTAPTAVMSKPVVVDSKKPHKSRFSPAASDTSKPAVVVASKSDKNDSTGKSSAGESTMPDNWPTSLKNFVTRSFGLCRTDGDRMNISQALEKLMNKVAFDGRITTHKWELEDVSACVIPVTTAPRAVSTEYKAAPILTATAAMTVAAAQPGSRSGSNHQKLGSNGADSSSSYYGSSSSGGHSAAVDYGSNDSNSRRLPRSPLPSPQLQAVNDKKRKNRWESESNGSNGDTSSYHNVAKQPKKGESKYKPQSAAFTDTNGDGYGNISLGNVVDKPKGTNQIIERPATKAEQAMREKRASRFKEQENTAEAVTASNRLSSLQSQSQIQFGSKNKQKKKIVENTYYTSGNSQNPSVSSGGEFDYESLIVIGTCQKLEKDYFRLTSAPVPSTVRPEGVLRESLVLLKKKWENSSVEYIYMCSQFKSIRQDLTVQHIQNDLTVEVYECHARVALECRDLNEYNQCQTQLKQLYCTVRTNKLPKCGSEMEFTAYRILYYVYLQGNKKYQNGSSDLADIIASLSLEAFKDPAVSHALSVRQSVQLENYHKFFQLCRVTPNLGNHILDLMIDNKRLLALQKVVRSYKPSVPASFVSSFLNFDSEEEGKAFMIKAGCVLEDATEVNCLGISMTQLGINTKDSVVDTSVILHQDKLLL